MSRTDQEGIDYVINKNMAFIKVFKQHLLFNSSYIFSVHCSPLTNEFQRYGIALDKADKMKQKIIILAILQVTMNNLINM